MRIQAQLIPQRTRGTVTVVGSYRDKNSDKELYLLSGGKKLVNVLESTDRVFQHTFEAGFPITFSFDPDDFQDKAIINFWKNHPLVKTEGYTNTNLVSEQFVFEIKDEKVRVEYDSLVSKLLCVSEVTKMSEQERQNLAFALGSDPRGMNSKEVYLHLIGLTLGGIAIAQKDLVMNYLSVKSAERVATVYANKAIQYGIVAKEGSVYKISGRNAGTTIDAVISMIMSDTDLFENYIKPEVDKKDADELHSADVLDPLDLPEEIIDLLPVSDAKEGSAQRKTTRQTKAK
jgi:hypothetical protein